MKGDIPFDSGRTETNKTSEGEYRGGNDRDSNLKGPSVTHPMVDVRGKDRKEGSKTFGGMESHTFGGSPNDLLSSLNIVNIGLRGGFFPGIICNHLLVRGTISFYKRKP